MRNLIGSYIGDRFQIIDQIGEGGMGVVFSAKDLQTQQNVALKVVRKNVVDPKAKQRFLREVETLAQVRSGNIIQVFAFGRDMKRGLLYAAMELADGNDLLDLIQAGRLALPLAFQVIEETCRALLHIHKVGIFHRDLKPSNIKIVPKDDIVVCKLLDFGLVQLDEGQNLTEQGQAPGTISYMSPEEINDQTTDHRIDMYKLGIVAYEMFTGRKPYFGNSPLDTVKMILSKDQPRLTDFVEVPVPVSRFVYKMMSHNPDDRYQTAADALEALNHISRTLDIPRYQCEHTGKSKMIFSDFKLLSHNL